MAIKESNQVKIIKPLLAVLQWVPSRLCQNLAIVGYAEIGDASKVDQLLSKKINQTEKAKRSFNNETFGFFSEVINNVTWSGRPGRTGSRQDYQKILEVALKHGAWGDEKNNEELIFSTIFRKNLKLCETLVNRVPLSQNSAEKNIKSALTFCSPLGQNAKFAETIVLKLLKIHNLRLENIRFSTDDPPPIQGDDLLVSMWDAFAKEVSSDFLIEILKDRPLSNVDWMAFYGRQEPFSKELLDLITQEVPLKDFVASCYHITQNDQTLEEKFESLNVLEKSNQGPCIQSLKNYYQAQLAQNMRCDLDQSTPHIESKPSFSVPRVNRI